VNMYVCDVFLCPHSVEQQHRYEDLPSNRKQWWRYITDVQVALLVEMECIA